MNYYPPYGVPLPIASSTPASVTTSTTRITTDPSPHALSQVPPLPTQVMTAPEGTYPLIKQINIDPKAYVGCTYTDRDLPIKLITINVNKSLLMNDSFSECPTPARNNSFSSDLDLIASSAGSSSSKLSRLFSNHRPFKLKSLLTKSGSTLVGRVHTRIQLSQAIRDGTFASAKEITQYIGQSAPPSSHSSINSVPVSPAYQYGSSFDSEARRFLDQQMSTPPLSLPPFALMDNYSTSNSSVSSVSSSAKDFHPAFISRSSSKTTLHTFSTMPDSRTLTISKDPNDHYTWLLMNLGQTFSWIDLIENNIQLSRIHFLYTFPTCIAVNTRTASIDCLDVILGFQTGDLFWYEAVHHRYNRINKGGALNGKPVTQVAWVSGSETQFVASFADGSMLLLDKYRRDREIKLKYFSPDGSHHSSMPTTTETAEHESASGPSWVVDEFRVTSLKKGHKHNPLKIWHIGKFVHGVGKAVTDFAFSSSGEYLAVTSLDGKLRVISFAHDCILDTYQSFFGGLTCITWTPDNRLILTGGQDDLISVWSFQHRRLVARCRGHTSWVSQIAVDEWRCDDRNIRFASCGHDGKLLFWDFPTDWITPRPYQPLSPTSFSFNNPTCRQRSFSHTTSIDPLLPMHHLHRLPNLNDLQPPLDHHVHPSLKPMDVPIIEPIMIETISDLPLWSLAFTSESVVVAEKRGRVLVWTRPDTNASTTS